MNEIQNPFYTQVDNPLFIYFHIPKTGGTTLLWKIGNQFDRTNDRWIRHYHWMTTEQYLYNNIPLLDKRTVDQQKQLKFLTGHGTYSMAHYWLKVRRNPLMFATFRDPVDRLLSSFNFRHGISTLVQDDRDFSYIDPPMDAHAKFNRKTAQDYSTLYEWYQDASAERNLQTKWMIKSFYTFLDGRFSPWEDIVRYNNPNVNPDIWPIWFEELQIDDYLYNMALECVRNKMWWCGTSDTLSNDIIDLCNHLDIESIDVDNRHRSGIDFPRYWTREEVEAQPDYELLLKAEEHDINLYNYVKENCKRPF
jgi:hypothetical protein